MKHAHLEDKGFKTLINLDNSKDVIHFQLPKGTVFEIEGSFNKKYSLLLK